MRLEIQNVPVFSSLEPAVFQLLYYAAFRIALRSDAGTVMGKKRLLG